MSTFFDVLKTFFSSFQKYRSLKKISHTLGNSKLPTNFDGLMQLGRGRAAAEEALYDLVERDPQLAAIMAKNDATRETLRQSYKALYLNAGLWVGRDFLPATSLACAPTLEFVLALQQGGQQVPWRVVGVRLLRYFEQGASLGR